MACGKRCQLDGLRGDPTTSDTGRRARGAGGEELAKLPGGRQDDGKRRRQQVAHVEELEGHGHVVLPLLSRNWVWFALAAPSRQMKECGGGGGRGVVHWTALALLSPLPECQIPLWDLDAFDGGEVLVGEEQGYVLCS